MKWVITSGMTGIRRTIEADGFDFDSDSEAYVFFSLLVADGPKLEKSNDVEMFESAKYRKVFVIPSREVLSIVEEAQA